MFTIRLYICVLAIVFLVAALLTRGIGLLDGTVVVSAVIYLILDAREELKTLRRVEELINSLE